MKTYKVIILSVTCVLGLLVAASAQPNPNPANDPTAAKAGTLAATDQKPAQPAQDQPPPAKESRRSRGEAAPAADQAAASKGEAASGDKPVPEAKADEGAKAPAAPTHVVTEDEKGLRLNFRGAPLEMVLNYLSDAAGFTIILDPDAKNISGKVDVWSNQSLTKDEALKVLNQVLSKQGYAILRKENSLTVMRREMMMRADVPVVTGNDPADIPKDDEIVTQIIPVRFINAPQVAKDLLPMVPENAELVSNSDGNALVITDKRTNIRRFAEIVKALDTAVSSLSSVKVFALKFADAKALATVVKELFPTQNTGGGPGGNDPRSRILQMMSGGRGGPGGMPGMPGSTTSGGRPGATKVTATSDERSNSLIVSAPADVMPAIVELVESIDSDVEEVTELRVFTLQHADPQETVTLLTSLFPDPTTSSRGSSGASSRFGRFGGGGGLGGGRGPGGFGGGMPGGGGGGGSSSQNAKLTKEQKVSAVADLRTSSVIVSASHAMMAQVAMMIEQLDADPKGEKKVFVYELKNSDVQNTEEIVRNLFEGANSRNRSSASQRSALETREMQSSSTMQSGSSSSGSRSSSQGRSGGSTFR